MPSKPTSRDFAATSLQMKVRLANIALEQFTSPDRKSVMMDPRTRSILQKNKVVKGKAGTRITEIEVEDMSFLANGSNVIHGPLMFFRRPDENVRRVFPASLLLFDNRIQIRVATIDYLVSLRGPQRNISKRTVQLIAEQRKGISSRRSLTWQTAAVRICDAIEDDICLCAAGLKQSMLGNLPDSYAKYFQSVMRPSEKSLEGLDLPFLNASGQSDEIKKNIVEICEVSKDLHDAFTRYFQKYGVVPLSGGLSISGLFDEWRKKKSLPGSIFAELWNWADAMGSPLARYHVTYLMVSFPELVPAEQFQRLWGEIAQIIYVTKSASKEYPFTPEWKARCLLASHFAHHIETRVPGGSGEIASVAAWLLAEMVSSVFSDQTALEEVTGDIFTSEHIVSRDLWQFVTPYVVPHNLRFGTLLTRSLWSTSMLCHLGGSLGRIAPNSIDPKDQERIEEALKSTILSQFPSGKTEVPAYAFEEPLSRTIEGWNGVSLEVSEVAKLFSAATVRASDWSGEPNPLTMLAKGHEGDDILICQALRIAAYMGQAPVERLWEMLQDEKWREELLLRGSEARFETFVDALIQIQVSHRDKWRTYLPHFFASGCEKARDDLRRRKGLFTCTMIASISGDTSSAMQRLLKGEHRRTFQEDMAEWRATLEAMQKGASAWASAKSRGVLAILHSTP